MGKITLSSGFSFDGDAAAAHVMQLALYAAIFRQQAGAPAWQARHGLTAAQYQSTFDSLVAEGYRLELVSGYTVGGVDQFAAIWTK